MRRLFFSLLLVVIAARPAFASPVDDVRRSMAAMAALHSYHMSSTVNGQPFEGDIVKPGRVHIKSARFEAIMLPDATYMKMQGKWMKFSTTGSRSFTADIDRANASIQAGNFAVTDLGIKLIGGAPLHAYRVVGRRDAQPLTLYVGPNNLPRRMDLATGTGPMTVTFSQFNAPIVIAAPM